MRLICHHTAWTISRNYIQAGRRSAIQRKHSFLQTGPMIKYLKRPDRLSLILIRDGRVTLIQKEAGEDPTRCLTLGTIATMSSGKFPQDSVSTATSTV